MPSKKATTILFDNSASIAYSKNLRYHGKSKDINVKYHFVKEKVAQGEINLVHVPSKEMIVDSITKPIATDVFEKHVIC